MARAALVGLACGVLGRANALTTITPSEGLVVVADRTYTVEWEGTTSSRFEIDLYYCGSVCFEDECGEWVTALCPYGSEGCPDNEGDFDIIMPEPMSGTSGSGYKVRVADVDGPQDADCSDEFYLMASAEAPVVGGPDAPYLMVTSPSAGDKAQAGGEYTVEFDYDNGVGSRVDRFKIDLYSIGGTGDCGTWVMNLCDKEAIGCKDSMGDYDVEIPETVVDGMYSIRVGRFEDDALYGCSGEFEIVGSSSGEGSGEGSGGSGGAGSGSTSSESGYGGGVGVGSSGSSSANGGGSGSGGGSMGSSSAYGDGDGEGGGVIGGGDGGTGEGEGEDDDLTGGGVSSGVGEGEGSGGSSSSSAAGEGDGEGGGVIGDDDAVGEGEGEGGGAVDRCESDDSDDDDDDSDDDDSDDGSSDDDFDLSLSYSYSYEFKEHDVPW